MMFQVFPELFEDILSILGYWDFILEGFIVTMWLYMWALMMGFFFGLLLAILRQYGGKILSRIATGYIELVRGTPLLAQLFLFYFGPFSIIAVLEAQNIPYIPIGGWSFDVSFTLLEKEIIITLLDHRTLIGLLTLGLNSTAYQAEYLRGAISSVGTGQLMAAQSLGMSRLSGIRYVVLPQALRRVIPAWSNEAAYLPKYTVVVWFIAVVELFAMAHYIVTKLFLTSLTYIIVALIFLALISSLSKILDIIHKKTSIPGL
ncbi:MAG: amino acid ABC transporter permease [Candidatus Hodarchaeota archaeon]